MRVPGLRTFVRLGRACALAACVGALIGAIPSCGRSVTASSHDTSDAAVDASDADWLEAATTCTSATDAGEPELPVVMIVDGGVPFDELALSLATARCEYWSRCSALARYVVSECIETLSRGSTWRFDHCSDDASKFFCSDLTFTFSWPTAELLQAVSSGVVAYDPKRQYGCLQALQAQACHGDFVWEDIPACDGVFTCPGHAADGDAGLGDAGLGDAGLGDAGLGDAGASEVTDAAVACSTLVSTPGAVFRACATDDDCAGAGPPPAGPFCVAGSCFAQPCGDFIDCTHFVALGAPCDSDPPLFGADIPATPLGQIPSKLCSPGLTCAGLGTDGTLGVCAKAQDVGGACAENAAISGCAIGLTCSCGACRLPPRQGSCAAGSCEIGAANCDRASNTCVPLRQIGGDCSAGVQACAPSLTCDTTTSTCQPRSL
jgi:hypothetical protein